MDKRRITECDEKWMIWGHEELCPTGVRGFETAGWGRCKMRNLTIERLRLPGREGARKGSESVVR